MTNDISVINFNYGFSESEYRAIGVNTLEDMATVASELQPEDFYLRVWPAYCNEIGRDEFTFARELREMWEQHESLLEDIADYQQAVRSGINPF